MNRFAICNEIFEGWPLDRTFDYVKKIGYDALEIAPFTLAKSATEITPQQRAHVRELSARTGLTVVGIHWVLAKTEGLHLTHPDAAIRERTAKYLVDLVNLCGDLGGKRIIFGSPKQRDILPGVSEAQAWDYVLEGFRHAVMEAEKREVVICFEPLSPQETNFINTAARAIEFVQTLNTPHFKIMLDVKAMCSEAKPIPQIIRESWPHFAHFHANDKNLKGPGFGEVDFVPIAQALHEVGFRDYVSVEVFNFDEGPERIATESLAYLRKTFATPVVRA